MFIKGGGSECKGPEAGGYLVGLARRHHLRVTGEGAREVGGGRIMYRLVGHSKGSVLCSEVDVEPLEGLGAI